MEASLEPKVWIVRAGVESRDAPDFEAAGIVGLRLPPIEGLVSMDRENALSAIMNALGVERAGEAASHDSRPRDLGVATILLKFIHEVAVDDFVMTPLGRGKGYICGVIRGEYQLRETPPVPGYFHVRPVVWVSRLRQDDVPSSLRPSLRAPLALYLPATQPMLKQLPVWPTARLRDRQP